MNRGKQRPQRTNNSRRDRKQMLKRQVRNTAPRMERGSDIRQTPARRPVPETRARGTQTDPFSPYAEKNNRQRYPQNYGSQKRTYYGTGQSQAYDYRAYSSSDPYQEQHNNYNPYQNYQKPRNTLGGDPYDHLQESSDWTKWIVTIVSGIIFLTCVIILIILLA